MGTVITGFIVFCFKRTVALGVFQTVLFCLTVKVCFIVKYDSSLYMLKGSVSKGICVMQTKSISMLLLLEPK